MTRSATYHVMENVEKRAMETWFCDSNWICIKDL